MKDLLLCVDVVVKTLNVDISRSRLADYVCKVYESACRTCSMNVVPHLSNQIVFWRCRCRCLKSLIAD